MHRHDFAQLVLPIQGSLAIAFNGREAILDRRLAAFVGRSTDHAQEGRLLNRSLILDLDEATLDPRLLDRIGTTGLVALAPQASSLIDYMATSMTGDGADAARLRLWTPLLLDALSGDVPPIRSRLARLLDALEARPFDRWTAASMAATAGLSVSRLHALFQQELETSPRAWLGKLRIDRVCDWLARTDLPIAELAHRGGYSDQSALTRALRKATGMSPAAYRRHAQESGSKIQDS
ncbi:helix-turn-helix transcriptional regulator [Sphingobium tyrosinilyticum]|uniref:AraC family transcriptional regulator n=1 Tax=Sphingobium tyrosinilyticum TaxID=2715436 RepID=A0ABV9F176_9SPHN